MLTHSDWHVFTVSVLKCKEVRKIYRDHPYGLKFYRIILPLHFTLHNNIVILIVFSMAQLHLLVQDDQNDI